MQLPKQTIIKIAILIGIAIIVLIVMLNSSFSLIASVFQIKPSNGLIISEIVSSNSNSLIDPVLGNPDWIELCNTSDSVVGLEGYSIAESNSKKYIFPDISLNPGEYILLYCCEAPEGIQTDKYCTGFKLSKKGTKLILSSPYTRIHELDVPSLETDISYGINTEGEYTYFLMPTPGKPNNGESFNDLAELKSQSVPLKINEVLPQGSSSSDPYVWVEIYNAGDDAIELSDYYITENLSDPTKARLPEIQLEAGEYTIVKFTGESGLDEVPFKIGKDETSLAISNRFGSFIDTISWDENILPGISVGRDDDGSTIYITTPTPGAANGSDYLDSITLTEGISDVRINEILLKNTFSLIDEDGDRPPWVELYNSSQNTLSLSSCYLSDDKDKILKWRLPDIELEPDSYLIVFLSGKDRDTSNELHTSFKAGNSDTQLLFTNLSAGIVHTVDLLELRYKNVSYGLSADGLWLYYPQPTPAMENYTMGFNEIEPANMDSSD